LPQSVPAGGPDAAGPDAAGPDPATHLRLKVLFPCKTLRAGGLGADNDQGEAMGTQLGLWTSRAWGFLADAMASLGSERTPLEALPMLAGPLASWSVYLADTPAKWLGTVDASTADEATEVAAKKFGEEPERLMAVRRA
jgi:hypothetical protein